ncbi:MAG: hypothetical protein ACYSUK_12895 [Planctomycetota bacterium]
MQIIRREPYTPAYKQNLKKPQNLPPELAEIVEAWPNLPEHIRQAVMALIRTVKG